MQENESITLPDGRTLSYAIYGSPTSQTTVFYFCGFPSSRFEGKLWHSVAEKREIRLIAPDRPGMGKSTFQPNRTLLDWPKDVLALADHLKIQKFYVIGTSGGGPYALACAKIVPKERLLGVSVVSGLYPLSFGTAGMLIKTRILLWIAPWFTGLAKFLLDAAMGGKARDPDPKAFEDLMVAEINKLLEGDARAIKQAHVLPVYIEMAREAVIQSSEGAAWDANLYGSNYGFEFGELDAGEGGIPLTLWHGSTDVNCPVSMAIKAKELIPGAKLKLKEGESHVSYVFRDADEILDDLVSNTIS